MYCVLFAQNLISKFFSMTLFEAVYGVVDGFISERINLLNKVDCTRFQLHHWHARLPRVALSQTL